MTVLHKNLSGTDLHEPKGIAAQVADKVYLSDGVGSGTWTATTALDVVTNITGLTALTAGAIDDYVPIYETSSLTNKKITTLDLLETFSTFTTLTAPAVDDLLLIYDLSTTTGKAITPVDLLEVLNVLTEDTTPDRAADFVLTYDTTGTTVKKATPNNLIGYVEDTWTPVLRFGGNSTGLTYTTQIGRYIKTGSLVTLWATIVINNNGSSTGDATISGIPYAASTATSMKYVGSLNPHSVSYSGVNTSARIESGASIIDLMTCYDVTNLDEMLGWNEVVLINGSAFSFQITYRTG